MRPVSVAKRPRPCLPLPACARAVGRYLQRCLVACQVFTRTAVTPATPALSTSCLSPRAVRARPRRPPSVRVIKDRPPPARPTREAATGTQEHSGVVTRTLAAFYITTPIPSAARAIITPVCYVPFPPLVLRRCLRRCPPQRRPSSRLSQVSRFSRASHGGARASAAWCRRGCERRVSNRRRVALDVALLVAARHLFGRGTGRQLRPPRLHAAGVHALAPSTPVCSRPHTCAHTVRSASVQARARTASS